MSKFLFFDIDGTLVGKSRHITEKTKEAIQAAKDAGNKVFLCTGRAPTSIVGDVKALPVDGIVASAGGFVQVDGKYIFKNFMDKYTLSEMMTLFVNHGILFCLETEHAIYQTPGVNEFFDKRHTKEFGENVELQRFFELKRQEENRIPVSKFDLENTGVTKIGFIAPDPIAFYDCVKYIAPMFNIVTFSKYEDDFINNEYINKAYKNLRDKFVYKEEGFELISKLTKEIEEKNIKEGQEREKYMKNNKPIITYILIFINIVMFVLMYMLGNGSENTNTLIDFGANYILLTKAGEYYRLITSGFLHIGVIHLLLNMYSLYIVGTQVEYFYGKVKYIIIYLFSLIMGSLFTVALSSVNTVSAGASGAIFGLLGSILYFGVKYRGYIGNSLVNQIVPVVVLNLIIGFTTPGIGNAAHIGGLVGGYLISMAVGIGIDKKEQQGSKINGIIISTILTIFMIYIGFIR